MTDTDTTDTYSRALDSSHEFLFSTPGEERTFVLEALGKRVRERKQPGSAVSFGPRAKQ